MSNVSPLQQLGQLRVVRLNVMRAWPEDESKSKGSIVSFVFLANQKKYCKPGFPDRQKNSVQHQAPGRCLSICPYHPLLTDSMARSLDGHRAWYTRWTRRGHGVTCCRRVTRADHHRPRFRNLNHISPPCRCQGNPRAAPSSLLPAWRHPGGKIRKHRASTGGFPIARRKHAENL